MITNMVRFSHIANGFLFGLLLVASGASGTPATGQSLLERPANIQGTWVGTGGTVYFNTMHRFSVSDPPQRKVSQTPTFLLAGTLPGEILVGANYTTNSFLVSRYPNEWEFFGRYAPLRQDRGAALDLAVQAGYNLAARSWDGQLTAARDVGPARILVAGRGFSAFADSAARFAVAAGVVVRVTEFMALAADYGTLVDRTTADGQAGWSAGLHLGIPYTPHTLSIHASNTSAKTLQGATAGQSTIRYGFEFTVPITLSRYFGGRAGASAPPAPAARDTGVAVEVGMTNRLQFAPDTVRITVGETVRWRNTSALLHTVTADPSKAADASSVSLPEGADPFDSGDIAPEATFEYTFTTPGSYKYFCIPHELAGMVGWVIVSEAGGDDAA